MNEKHYAEAVEMAIADDNLATANWDEAELEAARGRLAGDTSTSNRVLYARDAFVTARVALARAKALEAVAFVSSQTREHLLLKEWNRLTALSNAVWEEIKEEQKKEAVIS